MRHCQIHFIFLFLENVMLSEPIILTINHLDSVILFPNILKRVEMDRSRVFVVSLFKPFYLINFWVEQEIKRNFRDLHTGPIYVLIWSIWLLLDTW